MKIREIAAILLLTASASFAQRPRTGGGGNPSGPLMSNTQIIEGPVTSVNVTYGVQYPSIVVNQAVIKLGPIPRVSIRARLLSTA